MRGALHELGWTKAELARRLGINPHTVTNWRDEPPRYALAYLELALAIKRHGSLV